MHNAFDSNVMSITINGSTIRYAYRDRPSAEYEIRGVSGLDLARLRSTIGKVDPISSSATVQYLTHVYKGSHFDANGKSVKPARQSAKSLLPRTPYS